MAEISSKLHKKRNILNQIAKASEIIRRKHMALKLGRDATERVMSEVLKPVVTPLQKLVTTSENDQQKAVKKLDEYESFLTSTKEETGKSGEEIDESNNDYETANFSNENDETIMGDDQFDSEEIAASSSPLKPQGDMITPYMNLVKNKTSLLDNKYGVRLLKSKKNGNSLMFGNSPITFNNDLIQVAGKSYPQTKGLLELLFKKTPNDSILSESDRGNYKQMVNDTNAQFKHYNANTSIRDTKNRKYKKYIDNSINTSKEKKKSGGALPEYMIAEETEPIINYVYWDDDNELVNRLRLIMASQAAGNSSNTNEIFSVIEEMREAGIIY